MDRRREGETVDRGRRASEEEGSGGEGGHRRAATGGGARGRRHRVWRKNAQGRNAFPQMEKKIVKKSSPKQVGGAGRFKIMCKLVKNIKIMKNENEMKV